MQKQIKVHLDETEYLEIESLAWDQGVTVEEWVHQALRKAMCDHRATMNSKLAAITDASQHHFPTADIQTMLRQSTPR